MWLAKPVKTAHLFPLVHNGLLELLNGLKSRQWDAPTECPGWSVRDIAAHLLDVAFGLLARERDGHRSSYIVAATQEELVAAINAKNERWVQQMRDISPRLLIDLLAVSGIQVAEFVREADGSRPGPEVSWAGVGPHPLWLHIGRELTERWHHQQQMRLAVGAPLLVGDGLLHAVLATFAHSLPVAMGDAEAKDGIVVRFAAAGQHGGEWWVWRAGGEWVLAGERPGSPVASLVLNELDAWRMYTRSIDQQELALRATIEGDGELASRLLRAVAIIA